MIIAVAEAPGASRRGALLPWATYVLTVAASSAGDRADLDALVRQHRLGGRPCAAACPRSQRTALAASLAVNLALNATWNWLFSGLRSLRAGLAGTVLLDLSNAELIRRSARTDPWAAAALVPYGVWCAFATVLNADIARRNSSG